MCCVRSAAQIKFFLIFQYFASCFLLKNYFHSVVLAIVFGVVCAVITCKVASGDDHRLTADCTVTL